MSAEFNGTSGYAINKRIKLNIPLTRKQKNAHKQRQKQNKENEQNAFIENQKNEGECLIIPKDIAERYK